MRGPVRSPVVAQNALVGEARHLTGTTSSTRMGEAHVTAARRAPHTRQKESLVVFVLSIDRQPLDPCHAARARQLLKDGKAAVFRRYPFTIILKHRSAAESETHQHRLKFDPGSKTTGIAVVCEVDEKIVWAGELTHRGQAIRDSLARRRAVRRSRRQRKTRYRKPRFLNRCRPAGWLPPSLQHRVDTTMTWAKRLLRLVPVSAISTELVRFDTHLMHDAEISGVGYQQGELAGYEVREYLLEKWQRRCAYCGAAGVPLQVEHIVPRSRGGSDRVSNLTLACEPCNQRKGNQTAAAFGFPQIQAQARQPLKDAAAVNSTRWALYQALVALGLPVEAGTGGRTKFNRTRLGLPKAHWTDAACVGASTPEGLWSEVGSVLVIAAKGHGSRQMCRTDKYGFPRRHVPRRKRWFGFRTGDLVKATVSSGKYRGVHVGRVTIRTRPSFRLNGIDVHARTLRLIQRADGYAYATKKEGAASLAS
jgi:5-methylcytosine-specific restriction endonuclease McrA